MKQLVCAFFALVILTIALVPAQAQTPEPPTPPPTTVAPGTLGLPSPSSAITPTITASATPAVPVPTYPAPIAASPAQWTILYGQNTDITFAWISPVALQANQWFVIYLQWSFDPAQGGWSDWCPAAWTKDTTFVSTGAMRDQYGGCLKEATSGVGRGVQWFVVIQTMGNGGFTGNLSPESNRLIYIWEPYQSPNLDLGNGAATGQGRIPSGPPAVAVPTAPSTTNAAPTVNADDPNRATTIRGAAGGTLAPHAVVWYRFDYANNHQTGRRPWVTITLVNGNGSGVAFAVYAPENIGEWWNNPPTGRGTVWLIDCQTGVPSPSGECQSPNLMWNGNFGADGTYWIRVVNDNGFDANYILTLAQAQQ
jgi:hypothetical protein